MLYRRFTVCLMSILIVVPASFADRAPAERSTAKFVVEGVVESIEKSEDGEHDWFVVSIRLQKIEKGDGLKVGEVLKTTCYKLVRPKSKSFASVGHRNAPAKGTKIRAFVSGHETHGGYEGVYPEWFDKIDKK